MEALLKVYVLTVEPDGRVFYSEVAEPVDAAATPKHRGLRGWAEARLHRLKEGWQHSQSTAARLSQRVWDWLHSRTHPDETLLARLRHASAIEVHYPASMTPGEVAAAWSAFLARGRRRHWPWLVVNALVAPLTVVLAPLPGPNLIGYWFAYRAVHHLLILIGLARSRSGRVETLFVPVEALDRPIRPGTAQAEAAGPLAPLGCDPEALGEFLVRQGVALRAGDAEEVSEYGDVA
jgi:hypothetical protein